jgi:hypothetical protein
MCGIAKDRNAAGQVFIPIQSPFSPAIEAQPTLVGKAFHMQFVLRDPVAGLPVRMQRGDLPVRAPKLPVRIVENIFWERPPLGLAHTWRARLTCGQFAAMRRSLLMSGDESL